MKRLGILFILGSLLFSCTPKLKESINTDNKFSFVFMTDIHVEPERNATKGLLQAIDTINKLAPDFVLTGGDNIMDALAQSWERSDSLYNLYIETTSHLKMPVFSTIGNHENFGLYEKSGIQPTHEDYGKKMYEKRIGKRYYSFDHKNWHFVVLDGIGFTPDRHYYGVVDSVQIEWLKKDLEATGKDVPVAVSIHIPLLSIGEQIMDNPNAALSKSTVITNAHEVIGILEKYNVKLVLQGHLHFLEDIYYNGIHYITGGAVSSNWWQGPRFGMEEGFVKVDVAGDDFTWEYIDYGWTVDE
ncbi:MAG: metallophosphoesterase [Draconibacterium sp.]